MKLRHLSLSAKTTTAFVAVFLPAVIALSAIQYALQTQDFKAVLGELRGSVLEVKRDAAEAILQEVKIATEGSLQRGEFAKFVTFAKQQEALEEIKAFSFYDKDQKVALSSDGSRVGQPLDPELWKRAQDSDGAFVIEEADLLSFYCPLQVDADMHRLHPEWTAGELYGVLHLEFSKQKVNQVLATAQEHYEAGAGRTFNIVLGIMIATTVIMMIAALLVGRNIARPIKRVIAKLTDGAHEVNQVAAQLSSTSQGFAERAAQQASSVEETASAVEEMAAMTRTNAQNAKDANQLSDRARDAARAGTTTITRLNEAMTAINGSSAQISKIIKTIEEIAFQTNLLALNAAVEAARAGEHGKGFAVVADEVRNLAQRASRAAQETTELIQDSLSKAKEGADVATEVGGVLSTIIGDVAKVSDIIEGITRASDEQAQGVEQINTAVNQVDKVTQQNASGAEASASASEQLAAQAQAVNEIVNELSMTVSGRSAQAAGPQVVDEGGTDRMKKTSTARR